MKIKQYWKDKWELCAIHLVNTFFFPLKCLSQGKRESCSRRTKDFWKFHCNALFSMCFFFCQSTKKSQQTGNETAALSFFFVRILYLCLHDWQTWCFTFLTVTFPPQTAFKSHGAPAREQPVRSAHQLQTHHWTWGPGGGVNPSCSCLTFFSLNFSQPKFYGKLWVLGGQTLSWREWSVQCWLETTAVRGAKESLGNLSWSRGSKAKRHCDTGDYK